MLNACPPDAEDAADAYLLGHLPEADLVAYEQHCGGCAQCFEQLLNTLEFIRSVRGAPRLTPYRS